MVFSIIIPLYKNEVYLKECLNSIKAQTYTKFECIVINDCSPGIELSELEMNNSEDRDFFDYIPNNIDPDKQAKFILSNISKDDKRFKLVQTEKNLGQGYAQNLGLKKSIGDRFVIIDADDFIDKDFLEKAYKKIKSNPNKIYYNDVKVLRGTKIESYKTIARHFPNNNNFKNMLVFPNFTMTPFNYFWDLKIMKANKIKFRFPRRGQDTILTLKCLIEFFERFPEQKNQVFEKINTNYTYRVHDKQTTKKYSENMVFDHISEFLTSDLNRFYKLGFLYGFLASLFIIRLNIYRARSRTKSKFLKLILNFLAKFFTLISIGIASI